MCIRDRNRSQTGQNKTAQFLWALWRPREFKGMGPGFFQWRLQCWRKRSHRSEGPPGGWIPGHSWRPLFRVQEIYALFSSWTQNRNHQIRWCRHPALRRPLMDSFFKTIWSVSKILSLGNMKFSLNTSKNSLDAYHKKNSSFNTLGTLRLSQPTFFGKLSRRLG